MGRPVRMFELDRLYFVTNRTLQGRLLMTPSRAVNEIVGGILAESVRLFDVKLYNFVFLSNHYHMIVQAHPQNISGFMQHLGGNLARKLGARANWRGRFWDRRFSAEPILDDESLEERMRYIFAHGVKEGLVEHHNQWPGLTALHELQEGTPRKFAWPGVGKHKPTTLRVHSLPALRACSRHERLEHTKTLLEEATEEARRKRRATKTLGPKRVQAQNPHAIPYRSKTSPRPLCHAWTRAARNAFAKVYRAFSDAYRAASAALRQGMVDVVFPPHAHPPSLPSGWVPAAA